MDTKQLRAMVVADQADIAFQGRPVEVDLVEDKFVVKVDPMEADRCRLILGARYHRASDQWIMPATRSQAAGLSGVFGGRLAPTSAAKYHVDELFRGNYRTTWSGFNSDLFDFQEAGVSYLLNAGSALLGDEMGTGKTIQAIEWMKHCSGFQGEEIAHLVVAPNSMKFKWASEIEKWWPEATPVVIDGSAAKRRKQIEGGVQADLPVFVINYESLRAHTKLAPWGGKALTDKQKQPGELNDISWRCVVVDEAHKIKDPKAQQTMAVKQMGLQARFRLAMTGTPLLNTPDDIWSIMNFVAPDEWGSRNVFRNRYCRMSNAWHGGLDNQGLKPETLEEFDQFFQPRFLRRTKREVLPELPEKFDIDYRVLPMGTKQAQLYKALADDMMAMTGDDLLIAENPLSLLIRLRQAACGHLVSEDGEVIEIEPPSNKLDAIQDLLAEAPGDPLVIYAESRKFIEMLERQLEGSHRVGLVTGKQSAYQRERAVEQFQKGKLDVILGTLGAGAEGLTLTRANRIVIAQQSWSHGVNAQAIDRVHRIGQTRGVQPIVLVSKGTVDEAVALMDLTKETRMQELCRDPEWMAKAVKGEL